MATPFNADYGTTQGRSIPSTPPAAGDFVFQLGHATAGQVARFNPGDKHRISRSADLTVAKAVRATLSVRGPAAMPSGAAWAVHLLVNGTARASRTLDARTRRLVDFAANVSDLGGVGTVGFELVVSGGTGPYDAEIPGAWLDAVLADEVGQALEVLNRDPEPNEKNVPVGGALRFDVEGTLGGAVDLARTDVYVDDALACAAGVFQAGWLGSSATATATDGWAFALAPAVPLTASAVHSIRVVTALVGGPAAQLDAAWSFETVDLVAPTLLSAFATSWLEVRVVFDEPVLMVDAAAADDALNPANYALALVSNVATDGFALPAITPTVASVAPDTDSAVILKLARPATRRAVYQVTAAGVADLNGNPAGPPSNVAVFEGFRFPVPADRDFIFYELFPDDDRQQDEADHGSKDLRRLAEIIQEPTDLLLFLIDGIGDLFDPDTAPEWMLDLMLREMGNPFTFPLSLIEKRKLVQILVPLMKGKGTGPGIVDSIRLFMGIEVTINVPGWSPVPIGEAIMGEDFILGTNDPEVLLTFQVIVPEALDALTRRKMSELVDYMMSVRELFVIVEPAPLVGEPDHWALGFSQLGSQTFVH
ncbi:MAG: hypothetical protein EKK55_24500 [Rhodocyclaceae bacterium]|nr:MAG: hypothetical protein EKK55_24500 [Rhodocyclaceae bacterium]